MAVTQAEMDELIELVVADIVATTGRSFQGAARPGSGSRRSSGFVGLEVVDGGYVRHPAPSQGMHDQSWSITFHGEERASEVSSVSMPGSPVEWLGAVAGVAAVDVSRAIGRPWPACKVHRHPLDPELHDDGRWWCPMGAGSWPIGSLGPDDVGAYEVRDDDGDWAIVDRLLDDGLPPPRAPLEPGDAVALARWRRGDLGAIWMLTFEGDGEFTTDTAIYRWADEDWHELSCGGTSADEFSIIDQYGRAWHRPEGWGPYRRLDEWGESSTYAEGAGEPSSPVRAFPGVAAAGIDQVVVTYGDHREVFDVEPWGGYLAVVVGYEGPVRISPALHPD